MIPLQTRDAELPYRCLKAHRKILNLERFSADAPNCNSGIQYNTVQYAIAQHITM